MKTFHRLFCVVLLLAGIATANAADVIAGLDEFRKFASQQMKEDQVPGMSIGFLRWGDGQDRIWVEGFGYSDLENQVATKPDSAFRLGSVSKPMTAAAVLLLAERGKINLDAEVQTYVPYFPKKKWPVTVRQLLGHVGGISHYKNYDVEGRIKEHKDTREAIAIFEQFDLVAEPGTKYLYSSYGYNLLAAIVEGASGMPFGEFMEQNIWGPLGMKNTRLDDPAELIPNRVRGYRILNGQIRNSEFVDISSRLGGGGKRSTVPDLLTFAKGLVEGKILSPKSLELVYSSMATSDGHLTEYSAGWGIRSTNGHYILRHTGSQQETATILLCFPALKLAIACAVNQEDAGATVFANRLFEIIMKERMGLTAYVTGNGNSYRTIESVFATGMSYFELYGKPMTTDTAELSKAFDYLKRSLKTDPESEKLIADGSHLVSGQAFLKAGSYMTNALSAEYGPEHIQRYHKTGAIPFFDDYLNLCKKKNKKGPACAFPGSFGKLVAQWNESWKRANAEEIRWLRINTESNLEEIDGRMQRAFLKASAYPDFSRELGDLTWKFLLRGDNVNSLRAGDIGSRYYPESARLLAMYGISLVAVSDRSKGITFLQRAYKLDPASPAEPDWLSDFAEELAGSGKSSQAVNVLQAGIELHPKDAGIYASMGEAYLAMKDPVKAKEYFEKALELDPKHERAKTMLNKTKP